MNISLPRIIAIGIFLEALIMVVAHLSFPDLEDKFRYAARYSGRLSLIVFVYCFYLFGSQFPNHFNKSKKLSIWITLFAVVHLIHFGFLAMSVYLNRIPLETIKVIGGALAYLMIVLAPLGLHRVRIKYQLIYFYYVSLVMILTYVARIQGDFEGAAPHWFHYVGISCMLLSCLLSGILIFRKRTTPLDIK